MPANHDTPGSNAILVKKRPGIISFYAKDIKKNKMLVIMVLPVIIYYAVFCYGPMYGVLMAFQHYNPVKGIIGSPWIGLKNFIDFFNSPSAYRVIRNTLLLNIYSLLFSFPLPILLALLLNELRSNAYRRAVQLSVYLPHFISIVVVCGMLVDFCSTEGIFNDIAAFFGAKRGNMLLQPGYFRTIYIGSGIWQQLGWQSIIFFAALSGIDMNLYDSAKIDGCGRFMRAWHVTLPGIMSTIIILLILTLGAMMSHGYEKVILLYNPLTYETGDIISTFVYRRGLLSRNYSFSTAVQLFNSIINFMLLISANWISRRVSDTSFW